MPTRTRRQSEVLNFLRDFIESNGYSPSYSEIAAGLGLASKGAVARHIEALERSGLLSRSRDESGFILDPFVSVPTGCRHVEIPWYENPETVPGLLNRPPVVLGIDDLALYDHKRLIAFEVGDDSMSSLAIAEGDAVIIELRTLATDNETVLVEVPGGEIILRTYARSGSTVILRSGSDEFEELIIAASKLKIIGVMRGLVRPLR